MDEFGGVSLSLLKPEDKKLSSESVLLMSAKNSRVELSKSLTLWCFGGAVPRCVNTIFVSSKILAHRRKKLKGMQMSLLPVDGASS